MTATISSCYSPFNMLNEGVHVRGVSGVILFRQMESPIIYKQQIGRALTTGTQRTPLILDVVNNFGSLSSYGTIQSEMDNAAERLRREGRDGEIAVEKLVVTEQVRDAAELFRRLESSLSATWDAYYAAAETYFREHGDLLIPDRYINEDGLCLGLWLRRQRRNKAQLSQGQVERLERIGVVWTHFADAAWEKGYEHAAQFYRKNGHLLPESTYVCDDGYPLGTWIHRVRQQKNGMAGSDRLTAERAAALERIGMVWNVYDDGWAKGYARAKEYYEKHGDLNVPVRFKADDGYALGRWIADQRKARSGKFQNRPLSEEQIRQLDAIVMIWGRSRDERWDSFYCAAREYYAENGNLEMPAQYKTQDGCCLGMWEYDQKRNWRGGKLCNPECYAKLAKIGLFES